MTDTADTRIAELQERLERIEAEQQSLRDQLAAARVDQWKGRIEDMELQAHLASMDANDRVTGFRQDLQQQWQEAKRQLSVSKHTASEVVDTVREGIDTAITNLREALVEARQKSSRSD